MWDRAPSRGGNTYPLRHVLSLLLKITRHPICQTIKMSRWFYWKCLQDKNSQSDIKLSRKVYFVQICLDAQKQPPYKSDITRIYLYCFQLIFFSFLLEHALWCLATIQAKNMASHFKLYIWKFSASNTTESGTISHIYLGRKARKHCNLLDIVEVIIFLPFYYILCTGIL